MKNSLRLLTKRDWVIVGTTFLFVLAMTVIAFDLYGLLSYRTIETVWLSDVVAGMSKIGVALLYPIAHPLIDLMLKVSPERFVNENLLIAVLLAIPVITAIFYGGLMLLVILVVRVVKERLKHSADRTVT